MIREERRVGVGGLNLGSYLHLPSWDMQALETSLGKSQEEGSGWEGLELCWRDTEGRYLVENSSV